MRSSGRPRDRVVQRLDPNRREFPIVRDCRLGIDLVPALGDARVVELQDEAGIDDRLVLLAHRLGASVEKFLVGLVISVANPRAARRRDRGHKSFLDPGRRQAGFKAGDVGLDRIVAGIGQRADADRRRRPRPGGDAGIGIVIGRGEQGAVAAVAKAGQHDMARAGAARLHVVERIFAGFDAAEPLP